MYSEYGLFDRLLELGVLGFVAYEVIVNARRHHEAKNQQREQDRVIRILCEFLAKGQALRHTAPVAFAAKNDFIETWNGAVDSWIMDTNRFLKNELSPQASAKFLDDSAVTAAAHISIAIPAGDHFNRLTGGLNNLQVIIQFPSVYLL
jgi:hypothetical protein